jgi:hypothetical protein
MYDVLAGKKVELLERKVIAVYITSARVFVRCDEGECAELVVRVRDCSAPRCEMRTQSRPGGFQLEYLCVTRDVFDGSAVGLLTQRVFMQAATRDRWFCSSASEPQ